MATNDTSKPVGPALAIATGIVLLVAACTFLVFVVISLKNGEIWRFSKYHTGLVTRAEQPRSFWISAIFSSIFGLWLAFSSIWILRDGLRKLRK